MIGKIKYKFNRFMIKIYRKYFGRGLNPIYIIKIIFEIILTLIIAFFLFYFLLPEGL